MMAFVIKKTALPSMIIWGNLFPWISKIQHLGLTVTNQIDGCQEDMLVKNARYIAKNNQLHIPKYQDSSQAALAYTQKANDPSIREDPHEDIAHNKDDEVCEEAGGVQETGG